MSERERERERGGGGGEVEQISIIGRYGQTSGSSNCATSDATFLTSPQKRTPIKNQVKTNLVLCLYGNDLCLVSMGDFSDFFTQFLRC